ncbi:type VII toxin-antitoxin system MntA family adenylyltransferase antitoxin [Peribacillus castrilensis]|uniref:DNA polymerase subunit beta n=1 Tax=Peribacillus simplex TaxID=1478 RepID=A0AAN2PI99_9BACI|nr:MULTISPECIES: nucleotidyltransferase domain-containing protein [Bacillaceae]MCF7622008.1 nucleotidyltransferase domain-containing protein [Peribacillus frigoritolerans]MCP1156107.1 nucleotidyltransferase domain-containing protein [Peribacillus frigoritolerans]MCT1392008.1 nucleotidyltransferase domain-containing protein [Peribacillus frigoritolerans]PRA86369.1 nucleotidyltransferase domain-containing protein [Peribacillus simplex]CEG33225.1 DNA polymerase subunit beta [Peribacillus simplex]
MKTEMFQSIQEFLIGKIDPSFIIVFGSYSKNTTHRDSDIDVAFYSQDSSHYFTYEIFLLAQELADILKIDVDLVNLRTASTVFQAQIYTTGTVIYSKDDNLLKNQQMTALSMYAKLNEERENIMKKIGESGTIYEE